MMQEQGSRELPSIPSGPGLRLGLVTLGIGIINARQNVCSSRTVDTYVSALSKSKSKIAYSVVAVALSKIRSQIV